jgi:hypothetical protein
VRSLRIASTDENPATSIDTLVAVAIGLPTPCSIQALERVNISHLVDLLTRRWLIFSFRIRPTTCETSSTTFVATLSTRLPAPLTRFVGRQLELARAATLLAESRLLTLTGPGGAGKTRLAVQLASAITDQFPDGVWFVDF